MTDHDHDTMTDHDHDTMTDHDHDTPVHDPRRAAIVIKYNARTMYHSADKCPLCGSVVRYIAATRRGGCVKCSRYRVAMYRADTATMDRINSKRRAIYRDRRVLSKPSKQQAAAHARSVAEFDRLIDELNAKDEL